jgi:hypothetical protein
MYTPVLMALPQFSLVVFATISEGIIDGADSAGIVFRSRRVVDTATIGDIDDRCRAIGVEGVRRQPTPSKAIWP